MQLAALKAVKEIANGIQTYIEMNTMSKWHWLNEKQDHNRTDDKQALH